MSLWTEYREPQLTTSDDVFESNDIIFYISDSIFLSLVIFLIYVIPLNHQDKRILMCYNDNCFSADGGFKRVYVGFYIAIP